MTLVNLWLPFLIVLLILFVFFRNTGIEDPINREFIQPVAGLIYMLFGSDTGLILDSDYYTALILILFPILITYFATPRVILFKNIKKKNVKVLIIFALFGLLFNSLDIYYNFNFSTSIFNPAVSTFDIRGIDDSGNSGIKLIAMGTNFACMPLIAISQNFKIKALKIYSITWFVVSLFAGFSSPGKAFLILPFFYYLDYVFYRKVFGGTTLKIKSILNLNTFSISKRQTKVLILVMIIFLIIFISTLFLIRILLGKFDLNALEFMSKRIFAASLPLTWTVIRDPIVSLDINNIQSEFSNILEVWLKFLFKNLLNKEYEYDTIPKYIGFLKNYRFSGKSSMTSNLIVESTVLHGRYLGSLFAIFTCSCGAFIRRKYLSIDEINFYTILSIPIIETGPFFCFLAAQSWWTSFLPYAFFVYFSLFLVLFLKDLKN